MFFALYLVTDDQDIVFFHKESFEWNCDDSTATLFETMKDARQFIKSNFSRKSQEVISIYPVDAMKLVNRSSKTSYVLM